MPFTPFHFGPHACVSLPLARWLNVPLFLAANVAIDIEPLLVMKFNLNYPLHGYCHTLLIGGFIGLLLAMLTYPFRMSLGKAMLRLHLPPVSTFPQMALSGILGAWLHVLFDAVLYREMVPFFPFQANPLLGLFTSHTVYLFCGLCFLPAILIYLIMHIAAIRKIRERSGPE